MNLLIVGQQLDRRAPTYRGVDRGKPFYVYPLSEDYLVNELFFWSTGVYEDGYLHDLEKAIKLVDAYAQLDSPQLFEVIEITHNNNPPEMRGNFLGYDIASFGNSVLSWGMNYCLGDKADKDMGDLICLLQKYFQPHLNQNGLLSDFETGEFFVRCIYNLHHLAPEKEIFELGHKNVNMRTTGIYTVYSKR